MDSALRPRDIQARIRAGESPEDVAAAAGVPVERIAAFADPVLAEREHVAGLARTHPVRRRGETTSHRTLRNAVVDALTARGVDPDDVAWDAWKLEDRRWQVSATYEADGSHQALFVYEQMGRFSTAANDEGSLVIGDRAGDDLALVHATQGVPATGTDADEGAVAGRDEDSADPASRDESEAMPAPHEEGADDDADAEDAFHDGDLQEVDGVYDIVAPAPGELDVLYDMLSSFDEDSVKIYAGLIHPKDGHPAPEGDAPVVVEIVEEVVSTTLSFEVTPADEVPRDAVAGQTGQRDEPEETDEDDEDDEDDEGEVPEDDALATLTHRAGPAEGDPVATESGEGSPAEPEQLSLIDDLDPPVVPKARKPQRRKRASVPSWDEIMFGSPRPEE